MTIIRSCMIAAGGVFLSLWITVAAAKELPAFEDLDQNADLKIDAKEASAWEPLVASFDKVDVNHDGVVDPEEYVGLERMMDTMTKQGDRSGHQ